MPPILDVAIGTIFVFLLFSLVVSAFNELVLSFFDMRAKFLHKGLQEILGEGPGTKGFFARWFNGIWMLIAYRPKLEARTKQLCEHGLVSALSRSDRGTGTSPSYIPPGIFVTALFDILRQQPSGTSGAQPVLAIESLRESIEKLHGGSKLRESLLSLMATTGSDLAAFQTAVEAWFNASMDRVSGWYKRFALNWMILIGFGIAAVLNVDTIHIVQVLSNNPNLAKAVAAQAESYHGIVRTLPTSEQILADRKQAAETLARAENSLAEARAGGDTAGIAAAEKEYLEAREENAAVTAEMRFRRSVVDLGATTLPIGWTEREALRLNLDRVAPLPVYEPHPGWDWIAQPCHAVVGHLARYFKWVLAHPGPIFTLLAGWMLTAIAGGIGAPFWFDLLGRFINIRSAGKAPGHKSPTDGTTLASLDTTPARAPAL